MEWDYMLSDEEFERELNRIARQEVAKDMHRRRQIAREKDSRAMALISFIACIVFLVGLLAASYASLL
jgi:cell division septal protein FtsQ